jgi:hypothetical protein
MAFLRAISLQVSATRAHASRADLIEEMIFYPAAKYAETEEILQAAVEEHLSVKRIIADLVQLDGATKRPRRRCRS